MVVVLFDSNSSSGLEQLINMFLGENPLITSPKFHYSISSTGYFDQENKDGDVIVTHSVLISY